ncbi:MAG: tetratricopeptide repeat protein [Kineosporiaceae bacterium]
MDHSASPVTALRVLLGEAGCTYDQLARTVVTVARENGDHRLQANRSSVAHWLAGRTPVPRTRSYLVEALSRLTGRAVTSHDLGFPAPGDDTVGLDVSGDALGTASALASADLSRRSFLSTAAYSVVALTGPLGATDPAGGHEVAERVATAASRGRVVGQADVAAIRALTTAFTAADERLGGGHARDTVVSYLLRDVTTLCQATFATDHVRRDMYSAAAQVAHLAGWKSHDAGKEGLAQRYYLQAFSLARESGDDAHTAYMLRRLAHHALDVHRPDRSVELAHAAWDRGQAHTDPHTRSLFALVVARAHAAVGEPRQASRWLTTGDDLLSLDVDDPPPYWAELNGDAGTLLANHAAKTYTAMRRHDLAEPLLRNAATGWNPDTHPRVWALTVHQLGESQARQGHLEQACTTWVEAVVTLRNTRSARTRRALDAMNRTVAAAPRRRTPAVRDLADELRAA